MSVFKAFFLLPQTSAPASGNNVVVFVLNQFSCRYALTINDCFTDDIVEQANLLASNLMAVPLSAVRASFLFAVEDYDKSPLFVQRSVEYGLLFFVTRNHH